MLTGGLFGVAAWIAGSSPAMTKEKGQVNE
jgi:hypothetical protein